MDLPLVMAALMNRWGEDILPEEVAYAMEDGSTRSTGNTAFAAAAAGCCGYPCWQAWMDLADLREQIHDGCSVAVQVERRVRGQRDPVRLWMGLHGFGHDDAVMADFVLLNDPTADTDGAVNCTMALVDFMRYFTGKAIAQSSGRLRPTVPGGCGASCTPAARRALTTLSGVASPQTCRRIFPAGSPARPTTAWRTPPPLTAPFCAVSAPRTAGYSSRRSCWPQAGAAACMQWTRPAPCGWQRYGCRSRSLYLQAQNPKPMARPGTPRHSRKLFQGDI